MTTIAISPDGRWAAAGGWKEAGICVWDLHTLRLERILPPGDGDGDKTFFVSFSSDGRWLVSCSNTPSAAGYYFWEVGTWKRGPFISKCKWLWPARVLPRRPDSGSVGLAPAGPAGREPRRVATLAHLSTLQPLSPLPLAFSHDGTRLIASTNQKTALVWDLKRIRDQLRTMDLDWDAAALPT